VHHPHPLRQVRCVRELKPLMPLIETTKILPEYGKSDLDRIITALK
jgi:hypothetical protein